VHGEPTPTTITATDVAFLYGTAQGIQVQKYAKVTGTPGIGTQDHSPSTPLLFAAGSSITYTYLVSTTTATPLSAITLVDDNGISGNPSPITPTYASGDNGNQILEPGEVWVFTYTTTVPYGPDANVTRVSGMTGGGPSPSATVWADDINYHLGVTPKVTIVKAIDALNPLAPSTTEDANTQPAKELLVGTTAVWTYLVTNTGNAPVNVTTLVDNNGTAANSADDLTLANKLITAVMQTGTYGAFVVGDTNHNGLLDVGETWLYTASTTVQSGPYQNTATVLVTQPTTKQTASASDVAGYYGENTAQGLTPGYWKNHTGVGQWPVPFLPTQLVSTVFGPIPAVDVNETLLGAVSNGGGGTDALLRAAVAALLNTTSINLDYPLTATQLVAQVDAALASGNATTVGNLQAQLDAWNNLQATLPPPSITPTASINSVSQNEGNSGTTTFTFTITLSIGPASPASVAFATADGTATTANGDYLATSGTLTFAAGQTTATIAVTVNGDTVYEPNETFSVNLTSPTGLTFGTSSGTGTIVNDDATTAVSIAATQPIAVEVPSQAGVYTITRTGNLSGALTVNLGWSGTAASSRYKLTATGGTLNAAGTQLTMTAGVTSATVTLTPAADGVAEPAQTAVLTLGSSGYYALGSPSPATVTLYDTTSPTVSISPTTVTKAGSTSNQTLTFTVSLSGSSPNTTGVTVKTVNGTAVDGTDFTALSSTLSFAPGVTSQTVTVTLLGRKTGKVTKAFTVVLSSSTGGATLGTTTSTVTITGTSAQVAAGVAPAGSTAAPLTISQLQPVVAAAELDWEAAGVPAGQLASVAFVITQQLPLGEIGFTDGDTVYLDATAAGFGWYTGLTGGFDSSGGAIAGGPADGRMDLLTVVLHEIGHTVGLADGCTCGSFSVLMQATLPAGIQRSLPAAPLTASFATTSAPSIGTTTSTLIGAQEPAVLSPTPSSHWALTVTTLSSVGWTRSPGRHRASVWHAAALGVSWATSLTPSALRGARRSPSTSRPSPTAR
jgi:hypothetical protein